MLARALYKKCFQPAVSEPRAVATGPENRRSITPGSSPNMSASLWGLNFGPVATARGSDESSLVGFSSSVPSHVRDGCRPIE
jgi:hypothetical protein